MFRTCRNCARIRSKLVAINSETGIAPLIGNGEKSSNQGRPGKRKNPRLTYKLAETFCALVANAEISLPQALADNPKLPPLQTWLRWRKKHGWFANAWRIARETQAEHLAQKCLDIAKETDARNAHAQRLKFDVYRQMAKWLFPLAFGDKPDKAQTVNVGIAISGETLSELRARLDSTRDHYRPETKPALETGNKTSANRSATAKPETVSLA